MRRFKKLLLDPFYGKDAYSQNFKWVARLVASLVASLVSNYMIMNTLQLSIYTSMNTFPHFSSWMLAFQIFLDTLSDVLYKSVYASL
jgi:hypothetical protein